MSSIRNGKPRGHSGHSARKSKQQPWKPDSRLGDVNEGDEYWSGRKASAPNLGQVVGANHIARVVAAGVGQESTPLHFRLIRELDTMTRRQQEVFKDTALARKTPAGQLESLAQQVKAVIKP